MANLPPTDSERIADLETVVSALKKDYDEHLVIANRWSIAFVVWAVWATVGIGIVLF